MTIIKIEQDYGNALSKAYLLMQEDFELGSKKADELDVLTLLIEHYEEIHYSV